MSVPDLGKLKRADPREVWSSEPYHFTPWLRENVAFLGEATGLEIDPDLRQEVPVGLFSADLLGTDLGTSATVLIENQLEQTDHDHLGKLLTYAGGLDARVLIWVSTKVREEHRQALIWLNESTREDISFFGVEVELLVIDESRPAPHFRVVVEPNEWQKQAAASSSAPSERGERYRAFWRRALEELLRRESGVTTASPDRVPPNNWYGISIGRSGFQDNFVFGWESGGGSHVRIELYIDVGDQAENKRAFDAFHAEKEAIEAEFGEPLVWTRRDDIRASRIYASRPGSIELSDDQLDEVLDWGVDRMLWLRKVFGPRARALGD